MAFDESALYEQINSWKTKYQTLHDQVERIKEDAKAVLDLFGARKRANGSFDIDFDKLAANLGEDKWAELRGVLLARLGIAGAKAKAPSLDDPAKFAAGLTLTQALALRLAIDAQHRISGAPGEKPRVRVTAPVAPATPAKRRVKKRRKKRKDAGTRRAAHEAVAAA